MANGETVEGQDFDRERGLVYKFVQQVKNFAQGGVVSELGNDNTEIVPIDANASRVRVYDTAAILASIADEYKSFPSSVSFELPPTMTALTTAYNTNGGDGASNMGATGKRGFAAFGSNVGGSENPRASAQASAASLVDVLATIRPNPADRVPCQVYLFYMGANPTAIQVRAKLTRLVVTGEAFTVTIASPGVVTATAHGFSIGDEVFLTTTGALPTGYATETPFFVKTVPTGNTLTLSATAAGASINTSGTQSGTHKIYRAIKAWPHFKPEQVEILCKGQEAQIQQTAETNAAIQLSDSSGSAARSWGDGYSQSWGVTTKKNTYPPTLHAAITISSTSTTTTITTTVEASTDKLEAVGSGGTTTAGAVTNAPTALTKDVVASITPTSITATSPTDIPTSGLYLFPPEGNLDIFDLVALTCRVIDMSYFA